VTKVEREARKAWLDSLKVGDEVSVQPMRDGNPSAARPYRREVYWVIDREIGVVATKTQRHSVERFAKANGFMRKTAYHDAAMILPVTESHRATWKAIECRDRLARQFDGLVGSLSVSDDKVIRMCAILDEPETTKPRPSASACRKSSSAPTP
jgi:hypothetical protein